MHNNEIIERIILSQKDFHLLPRDEDGYCYYDSNLVLTEKKIKILPEKLKIKGFLNCSYNKLTSLPNGLIVGIGFSCNNNQLVSLPDDISIGGSLHCTDNNLTSLPDGLIVKGFLECSNNQLTSLPDSLIIRKSLHCNNNYITTEIKCEIGGTIYMDDEQKKQYDRIIKLNKIKDLIHG